VLAWRGEKRTVVHFYWRNQTLMDMFGALWITRYAQQGHEDDWFHKQLDKKESREVCQLATEMPLNDSPETFAQAMRVIHEDRWGWKEWIRRNWTNLFRKRPARRWTEWIYRSWPNLLQAAGYLTGQTWENRDLFAATIRAQEEARGRVERNQRLHDSNPAKALLLLFLGEFPKMCAEHSSRAGNIARQLTLDGSHKRLLWDGKNDELKPGEIPNFIKCPAGKFWMGEESDEPYRVEVSDFWLQSTAVTVAQYRLFDPPHTWEGSDDCPVTKVSWYDAWVFALWVGGLLPTDAQWEYASRGVTETKWKFDGEPGEYAWYDQHGGSKARPVATRRAGPWGLYDMYGNVWEWCWDWDNGYERTVAKDPTGPCGGSRRVFRGGGWRGDAYNCRSANRYGHGDPDERYGHGAPEERYGLHGFRVARAVSSCRAR
jgi:formylglycine-generating enzyme required for sulfatase activity